jgi:hypothetical protein
VKLCADAHAMGSSRACKHTVWLRASESGALRQHVQCGFASLASCETPGVGSTATRDEPFAPPFLELPRLVMQQCSTVVPHRDAFRRRSWGIEGAAPAAALLKRAWWV